MAHWFGIRAWEVDDLTPEEAHAHLEWLRKATEKRK